MAPPRIFDPTAFKAQGALITTRALFKGFPRPPTDLSDAPRLVFLRWQVNPRIGMPVEPFKVWRRQAIPVEETAIEPERLTLPPLGQIHVMPEPMVSLSLDLRAGSSGAAGNVVFFADGIGFENILAILPYNLGANGATVMRFQAAYVTAVLILGTGSVQGFAGLPQSAADKIGGWELVETVGLPVDEGGWSDLADQNHGVKQGLVGAEVPAPDAAAQRYARGINPFGWHQTFPTGEIAPAWTLPSPKDLIADADTQLLPMLHEAMRLPPADQAGFTRDFQINPPENPSGQQMSGDPGRATIAPLTLLQMTVSTDPLQAVTLGFGTGYLYEDIPGITLGAMSFFDDRGVSDWDFMVTGLWRGEGMRAGREVEFAALIPRPRLVLPPPAPADLALDFLGHHQPAAPDGPWSAATRLSWERLPLDNLSRVASFAAGRADLAQPGQPAHPLMERRATAPGHLPIGDARNPQDPEPTRQSASDSFYPIPNDPGSVSARYGIATQNIFGIWSPWVVTAFDSSQPDPDAVQIVDANLVPTDPGPPATVCPGELRVEIVLDWRARRPASVAFRGRLFASATRHDDPPAGMPGAVQTDLAGATRIVTISFAGDVPSVAGGSILALNSQGDATVAPGPAQGSSRRYRLIVPGFSLDYAATPHIGLALSARLQERLAPMRTGAWSPPKLAYASDPRARLTNIMPIVPLTSLPDAGGQGHARLSWAALPGAAGYVVYTSNEFTLLDRTGQPRAAPDATLSQRLVAMQAAFDADPDRNAFTRVNDTLLTATSLDVAIPRGSQAIHAWIVLPVSAGGTEAPWPMISSAMIVYAAPKVAEPAPPRIEVRRIEQGAGFAARIRVETRADAGARPRHLKLYRTRVADAARALDSMGLPVAEISASGGGWSTTPPAPAADGWIDVATGTDAPGGSWKHVWYRAVALADGLPQRGVLGGRSLASPAVPVLIPPAGPPPLSALALSWPGGGPGDVLASFATDAPVAETPLGAHILEVEALEQGLPAPVIRRRIALAEIAAAAPAAPDSGLWRSAPGQYSLLLRRADVTHSASLTIRLIDPLGRASERVAAIGPGVLLPPPQMSEIDSFSIAGRGKVFTFTLANTRDDMINGQPWRLRIELAPATIVPPTRFPRRGVPGGLPGRGIPLPGGGLTIRGRTQFTLSDGKWIYDAALASIPVTAPDETFAAARQRVGDSLRISIMAKSALRAVSATITGPDGASDSKRVRG